MPFDTRRGSTGIDDAWDKDVKDAGNKTMDMMTSGAPRERQRLWESRWVGCWIVLLALAGAAGLWFALPAERLAALVAEGSLIEESTAFLYCVAAVAAVAAWTQRSDAGGRHAAVALCMLMLACAARELDLHIRWTSLSVLKVSFYLGSAPVLHKLVALAVVSLPLAALAYLFRTRTAWLLHGLRRGDPRAITIIVFVATMILSKTFDRSASVLREDFGMALARSTVVLVQDLEELMEATLPLLAMLGFLQHRLVASRQARGTAQPAALPAADGSNALAPDGVGGGGSLKQQSLRH
jgi:hypothetical protein